MEIGESQQVKIKDEAVKILKTKLNELSSTPLSSPSPSPSSSHSASASSSSSPSSSNSLTFRAPHQSRQVNGIEPQIISIGPYHCGKYHTMEIHKIRYLRNLLKQQVLANQGSDNEDEILNSFVVDSQTMEVEARNFYEENFKMSSAEFVAMMVLDGLFVIELLRKFSKHTLPQPQLVEEKDDIFKLNLNLTIIAQDLLLLGNQLPFFVLDHFSEKTKLSSENPLGIMAVRFFSSTVPVLWRRLREVWLPQPDGSLEANHLLGLVHHYSLPSLQDETRIHIQHIQPSELLGSSSSIRSTTELRDVGITFKKKIRRNGSSVNSLFDIKFENGVMHIPTLTVDHDTEKIFRNLIAYEQLHSSGSSIVMDYARLMDCLINYAEDVALLSNCEIIDNRLGTKDDVAIMFNKLNDYVYLSTANFYYSKIFKDVNEYCNRPLNLWKVKLRQAYFYTPWVWILTSIAAASILLLLTLVQTIFTVLAYVNK